MSFHKTRGRKPKRGGDVWPGEDHSPEQYFGDAHREGRGNWKREQLCKQVERAAALVVGDWVDDVLLGAAVASVEPWPDAARLRITVVLASPRVTEQVQEAHEALTRAVAAFRAEIARSIRRKRVPEIAFQVMLSSEDGR